MQQWSSQAAVRPRVPLEGLELGQDVAPEVGLGAC